MLHVFHRVESIHKMQAGFSLEYENIPIWFGFELQEMQSKKCEIHARYIFVTKMVHTGRSIITLEATRRASWIIDS